MNLSDALDIIGQSNNSLQSVLGLFDFMPNIFFYIKNKNRRFLWMNEPLRQHVGAKSLTECVGKEDADFFASDLVFLYRREDDEVFTSRSPLLNRPWIVPERKGRQQWFLSSKIPMLGAGNEVVALAGIMQNLTHEFEVAHPLGEMQAVVDHVIEHYHERIGIETLASLTFLSPRQFERRFRSLFHSSPGEFILKVRIDAATRLLMESDLSITQIAIQCGFYDNSHFTRLFKKKMSDSPIQFRKKFSEIHTVPR